MLLLMQNIAFFVGKHCFLCCKTFGLFPSENDCFRLICGLSAEGSGVGLIKQKRQASGGACLFICTTKNIRSLFGRKDACTLLVREGYTKSFSSRCSFWRVKKMRLFTVPKGRPSFSAISRYLKPATCMENGMRYSLGSALTMRCISFRS